MLGRTIIAWTLAVTIIASMMSCLRGPRFLGRDDSRARELSGNLVSDHDGARSYRVPAAVAAPTVLTASPRGAIAGTRVVMPPNALSVDSTITIEEGALIAGPALAAEIGLELGVTPVSRAVVIDSSVARDPAAAPRVSVPIDASMNLVDVDPSRLVVFYVAARHAEGRTRVGVIPLANAATRAGRVTFEASYFGSYQVAAVDRSVAEARFVASDIAVLSARDARGLAPIVWEMGAPLFDSAQGRATFPVRFRGLSGLRQCAGVTDDDMMFPWLKTEANNRPEDDIRQGDWHNYSTTPARTKAHTLHARLECLDATGRIATSGWSPGLAVPATGSDAPPFAVLNQSPNTSGTSRNAAVEAEFSADIDSASLSAITVTHVASGATVAGTATIRGTRVAEWRPASGTWASNAMYEVRVENARSTSGNVAPAVSWRFRTLPPTLSDARASSITGVASSPLAASIASDGNRFVAWMGASSLEVRHAGDSDAAHAITTDTAGGGLRIVASGTRESPSALLAWSGSSGVPMAAWFDGNTLAAPVSLFGSSSAWTIRGIAPNNVLGLSQHGGELRSRAWDGSAWSPEIIVTGANAGVVGQPALASRAGGATWWSAWVGPAGSGLQQHVWVESYASGVWDGTPVSLTDEALGLVVERGPAVSMDSAGNVVVVWLESRAGASWRLVSKTYRASSSGGVWEPLVVVESFATTPAIDALGVVAGGATRHVAWWRTRAIGPTITTRLRASTLYVADGAWDTASTIEEYDDPVGGMPLLDGAVDADGNGVVWWTRVVGGNATVRVAYYDVSIADIAARWVAARNVIEPAEGANVEGAAAAFGSNGDGLFLWSDQSGIKSRALE